MEQQQHQLTMMEEEWVVEQFEGMVRKQLFRMNISYYHADYEDLLQEGRLVVLKTASEFVVDWNDEVDVGRFMCLAGKRIRWRLLDFLRHNQREAAVSCDDEEFYYLEDEDIALDQELEQVTLMKEVRKALNDEEWQLVVALMDADRPRTQIAKDFHMSRKILYTKRKELQKKLKKVLKNWNTSKPNNAIKM
ncbi:RNA polymerase sigma factor, sigma-70 family [Granulicatella balaenopterae]|uniref:RNA polymerase sigma factor, sigma-70 family n=1 Tax=Granulicatella balaenopterae TaxID=137733 RepID=A0A1H9K398_9LACT|nr:sigma-70 family RNA polymerase sigma factor [Granulicatella balaenopterae]SEQ93592.1 RNA polymerase sigma factor, sigma-70 family [Granulicatella balaenopterae]